MFENITYSDIVNAPPIETKDCSTCRDGYCTGHKIEWFDGTKKDLFICTKPGLTYFECLLNGRKEWRER